MFVVIMMPFLVLFLSTSIIDMVLLTTDRVVTSGTGAGRSDADNQVFSRSVVSHETICSTVGDSWHISTCSDTNTIHSKSLSGTFTITFLNLAKRHRGRQFALTQKAIRSKTQGTENLCLHRKCSFINHGGVRHTSDDRGFHQTVLL